MCCFTGRVEEVGGTRIFARMASPGRQLLAYQMEFRAADPVAMVLPLPSPAGTAEDAVRFISLEGDPTFFQRLRDAYFPVSAAPAGFGPPQTIPLSLKVHEVGDFIASFVPSLADFTRLDPQFRMPAGTLDRIPEIADWGFAVFQLSAQAGRAKVHPMSLEFPTRADRLFFPTLHVHDGAVHPMATFDHELWAQGSFDPDFAASSFPLGRAMRPDGLAKSQGLLDGAKPLAYRRMSGMKPNLDTWALVG